MLRWQIDFSAVAARNLAIQRVKTLNKFNELVSEAVTEHDQ